MTDIIHDQSSISDLTVNRLLSRGIPLTTRRAFLRISIEVNFHNVISGVVCSKFFCMFIRVLHVLDFSRPPIAIHVVRNEANTVSPASIVTFRSIQAARFRDISLWMPHVSLNLVHHCVGLVGRGARYAANTDRHFVANPFPIFVRQKPEIIIADVTGSRTD